MARLYNRGIESILRFSVRFISATIITKKIENVDRFEWATQVPVPCLRDPNIPSQLLAQAEKTT
jgi:hypothetical protein